MPRAFARIGFLAITSSAAFGQAPATPTAEPPSVFDLADVHVSPRSLRPNMQPGVLRAGRYQLLNATMVDLIRTAYGVDADKVLGGPSWLESDRFDVIAKAPPATPPEKLKPMLQALLADRFKLVVRRDTHPLPAFTLTVAKGGPKLKEADGSGEPGCTSTTDNTAAQNVARQASASAAAAREAGQSAGPTAFLIQPTYTYKCGNVTMAAFAEAMHTMPAAPGYFGTGIVVDQTGLKGEWDITLKYTPKPPAATANPLGAGVTIVTAGETILLTDSLEKQLGLKLDPVTLPTPVIIVESVNRKPADNPPGVTTALPPPPPTEFEVADLRLAEPGATAIQSQFQPNGRANLRNFPLVTLINQSLNPATPDTLVGMPKFASSVRVDLIAKLPLTGGLIQPPYIEEYRPALLALLKDRFKFAYHTEERPADAYTLVAAKPKLKKTADPLIRTNCKEGPGADGKDPRTANSVNSRLLTCVNMTMAEFAEQLPLRANGYIRSEVLDATGLDGAYDFTLNFAANGIANLAGALAGRGGDGAGAAGPAASEPNGAISLFDAVEKQLGLKLELHKRPMPVIVIDHLEQKPTDN